MLTRGVLQIQNKFDILSIEFYIAPLGITNSLKMLFICTAMIFHIILIIVATAFEYNDGVWCSFSSMVQHGTPSFSSPTIPSLLSTIRAIVGAVSYPYPVFCCYSPPSSTILSTLPS